MNGFYVPNSVSSSYVSNKRNEEGSLAYDSAANEIGIQKQAAVQQLEKNYATTIENAYASYLAANRGVDASNMGQGYKELYKTIQQQQLRENIANTNTSFNEAIASLNQQESEAQAQIQSQFQTEVAYFDRLKQSFADYFDYVKTLTNDAGETYLDESEMTQTVDSMYNVLKNTMPQGYLDEEGNMGMSYEEWIKSQLGDTEEDTAWSQWLFSTGLNEFMEAPKKMRQYQSGELQSIREENEALQADLQTYINLGEASNRVNQYLQDNPDKVAEYNEKRRETLTNLVEELGSQGNTTKDKNLQNQLYGYIKDVLPSTEVTSFSIDKNWGKRVVQIKFSKNAELSDTDIQYLKDLGFTHIVQQGNPLTKHYEIYTDDLTSDEVKEFYLKLYDLANTENKDA